MVVGKIRKNFLTLAMGATGLLISQAAVGDCLDYEFTLINGANCPPFGTGAGGVAISEQGAVAGITNNCAVGVIFLWTGGPGYQAIVSPPNTNSFKPYAINNAQQVVGYRTPNNNAEQGILVQNGVVTDLASLPRADRSTAYGISDDGTIVGYSEDESAVNLLAVQWIGGKAEQIPLPLGPNSVAYDISNTGHICGWMGVDPHPLGGASGFIYKDGIVTDLGVPLPDSHTTQCRAVNNLGQACGIVSYSDSDKDPVTYIRRGFFWSDGQMVDLGTLPGMTHTFPTDLNDAGIAVGFCLNQEFRSGRAFMWHEGVMTDLNDFLPAGSGFKFEGAEAINNAGQIAGHVRYPNGDTAAYVLSPAPATTGDYDCDKDVDVDDLLGIINRWGPVIGDHPADFTDDGQVNVNDLMIVIDNWSN